MAAPVSSVSSLVLFDTHKTTKAVRIHFLADKNFRQTILAPGVCQQPCLHARGTSQPCALAGNCLQSQQDG